MKKEELFKKIYTSKNIIIPIIFFILGLAAQSIATAKNTPEPDSNADLSLFWEVWETMEDKYPFEEPLDEEKIHSAITGLVGSYDDDYSSFLPPIKTEFFQQNIEGEFGGIGAEIGIRGGYLSIISPLKNSPAEKSGVLPGDVIIEVNKQDITDLLLDDSISLIRGPIGTEVELTILRITEPEPIHISITRGLVEIPTVATETIEDVFIISLYNFNEPSEIEFKKALTEFKESGLQKLVLDLRNNPGGYLSSSIDIASYFIPQGDIILREQYGEGTPEDIYRSYGHLLLDSVDFDLKVLINRGSASASEIVAGALSDHNLADVVGERSYGKGSVQELVELPKNTSLKVTVAKWLTPLGGQISKVGIEPDITIEAHPESELDQQLLEAIRLFNSN